MKRALLYFLAGTAVSFLLNYLFVGIDDIGLELYYAIAFGFAWGLAYYLDTPNFSLPIKLGISLLGMVVLVAIGIATYNFELAMPSVIKFSTVFVAYYLIASFRATKSLRT